MVVSFAAQLSTNKHFNISYAGWLCCITVKLEKQKITAVQKWSFYTGGPSIGCTVLGHIHEYVRKLYLVLLGAVIGGVHSHLAIISFKLPLHATTYSTRYAYAITHVA